MVLCDRCTSAAGERKVGAVSVCRACHSALLATKVRCDPCDTEVNHSSFARHLFSLGHLAQVRMYGKGGDPPCEDGKEEHPRG